MQYQVYSMWSLFVFHLVQVELMLALIELKKEYVNENIINSLRIGKYKNILDVLKIIMYR